MNIYDLRCRVEMYESNEFSGGVDMSRINEAAKQLDVVFPDDYIQFLSNFGSGSVESEEFIGLGGETHLNVVAICQDLRNRRNSLPASYIPLRNDGFGNYDCIDAKASSVENKCVVVEWLHDGKNKDCRILAHSYYEWFLSILDMVDQL